MQARREWSEMLFGLKDKNNQSRILYPEKLSFKSEGDHLTPQNGYHRKDKK